MAKRPAKKSSDKRSPLQRVHDAQIQKEETYDRAMARKPYTSAYTPREQKVMQKLRMKGRKALTPEELKLVTGRLYRKGKTRQDVRRGK